MPARSINRADTFRIAGLLAGLCLASIPAQAGAAESQSPHLQRVSPEHVVVDSREAVSFIRGSLGRIDLQDADRNAALQKQTSVCPEVPKNARLESQTSTANNPGG